MIVLVVDFLKKFLLLMTVSDFDGELLQLLRLYVFIYANLCTTQWCSSKYDDIKMAIAIKIFLIYWILFIKVWTLF